MTEMLQPYEVIGAEDNVPLLFVVDHASAFVPKKYDNLGLPANVFATHVAIDIGAKQMAEGLVKRLGGRAVLAKFSRLLIDPNRELWRDNLVPDISDGIPIPRNANLSEIQKQERIENFYNPFHQAVDDEVQSFFAKGLRPLVVGVHSFTPEMGGEKRPWHIGFMWNKDDRLGLSLAKDFEAMGKTVGHNLPYGGDDLFHTMMSHGFKHGLPHTQIEVRQDLVGDAAGADHWAELIAAALAKYVKNPQVLGSFEIE